MDFKSAYIIKIIIIVVFLIYYLNDDLDRLKDFIDFLSSQFSS